MNPAAAFHAAACAELSELEERPSQAAIADVIGEHASAYGRYVRGEVQITAGKLTEWLYAWHYTGGYTPLAVVMNGQRSWCGPAESVEIRDVDAADVTEDGAPAGGSDPLGRCTPAYWAGRQHVLSGAVVGSNPHDAGTQEFREWRNGHDAAAAFLEEGLSSGLVQRNGQNEEGGQDGDSEA